MPYNETPTKKGIKMEENKITKVKKHVYRNRAKYAAGATLTVCVGIQLMAARSWNKFLDEHDLLETYYDPER